jgi:peptide/nickel transport system ATP-binding protein
VLMTRGRTARHAPRGVPGRADCSVAQVNDLHVTFRRNRRDIFAIRGVSLNLVPGEILGVVGESGSGKSALGLALLGLLPDRPRPRYQGTVEVMGVDMLNAPAETRRLVRRNHLGSVFQDPMTSLNPSMKVGRQVEEAAGSTEEALRLLDAVGVPDASRRMDAYPHELSGGLRQRVMIAMAVAGHPALVVADEPTTALDVTVQAQILDLIRSLRSELDTTFLIVTHDLGVAAEVADRIAVMYAGRLAEVGPAGDVCHSPIHPYSRGLLTSRLSLDTDRSRPVATLPGEPPDPRDPTPGCSFAPRCTFRLAGCEAEQPEPSPRPDRTPGLVACLRVGQLAAPEPRPDRDLAWPESVGRPPGRPARQGTAVIVKDLHKSFEIGGVRSRRRLHALRGVDLEIDEGEAVALVGESGCGKSTLLRCVAGLAPVDSGFVDLARGGRPQMVFQDAGASLTPWMSVGELIGERLREEHLGPRARRARVEEVLAQVGLPPEVGRARPHQLSGGQRQRVALARATVVPPEVLLCDEPTSALDVSLAGTILNLIGRLRRELGMAVLFVTHDLAAARIVADRIAVMYLGRIVELGAAEQVTRRPVHPYTNALLAAVPGTGTRPGRLGGEPPSPVDPPPGCEFQPRCPQAEPACRSERPELAGTGPEPPTGEGIRAAASHLVACPVAVRGRR